MSQNKNTNKDFILCWLQNGGLFVVIAFAVAGIFVASVGFYSSTEFSWKWFLCLHLPIYLFCFWALSKSLNTAVALYKQANQPDKRKHYHRKSAQHNVQYASLCSHCTNSKDGKLVTVGSKECRSCKHFVIANGNNSAIICGREHNVKIDMKSAE